MLAIKKEKIMDIVLTHLWEILGGVVAAFLIPFSLKAGSYLNKKIEGIDNENLEQAAYMGVVLADKLLSGRTGQEKFKHVYTTLTNKYPTLSHLHLEGVIEKAYQAFMGKSLPQRPLASNIINGD